MSDLDVVLSEVSAGSLTGTAGWSSILSALATVTPTTTVTNTASAISSLSSIHSAAPSANLYEFIASLVAEGLTTDSVSEIIDFLDGELTGENGMTNV